MTFLALVLVVCQAFGALIGAAFAVVAELRYVRAIRYGRLDTAENEHIDTLASGLWSGMLLTLGSSIGLVILSYVQGSGIQPGLTSLYWGFITLVLLITILSSALSRRRISFVLGSAAIFTAWWMLVYLSIGHLAPLSFGSLVAFYVLATALIYAVLQFARYIALPGRG